MRYGFTLAVNRPADALPLAAELAAVADGLGHAVDAAPAPMTELSQRDDGRKEASFHIIDGAAVLSSTGNSYR